MKRFLLVLLYTVFGIALVFATSLIINYLRYANMLHATHADALRASTTVINNTEAAAIVGAIVLIVYLGVRFIVWSIGSK